MRIYFALPIVCLLMASCAFSVGEQKHKVDIYGKKMGYDYTNPALSLKLNAQLTEISGLTYNDEENTLLTINDEEGIIFNLDETSGSILGDINFYYDGDFEGIEKIGDRIFVIKSNGNIYSYLNEDTQKIETPLSSKNDVEGLGYDVITNQMLLACKSKPLNGDFSKGTRAIYAYNIQNDYFNQEPYLLIKPKSLLKFLKHNGGDKKLQKQLAQFSPSGIAVHPHTNEIYILSAVHSLMLVYSPKHKLIQCVFFDKQHLPQPEGICFSPDGSLFISTEGQGSRGRIFKYRSLEH